MFPVLACKTRMQKKHAFASSSVSFRENHHLIVMRIWKDTGVSLRQRKISHFSHPPFLFHGSAEGACSGHRVLSRFIPFLRVLSFEKKRTCQGLVEEARPRILTFYFDPTVAATAVRLLLLLSSRGLIAINRGLVGFGFVAIASDIHACTQSRCLTGAFACRAL